MDVLVAIDLDVEDDDATVVPAFAGHVTRVPALQPVVGNGYWQGQTLVGQNEAVGTLFGQVNVVPRIH